MRPGSSDFDIGLAAAEHHRLQPAAQFGEVLIVDRPAALVEFVEVAVEAEQRPDQFRVEVLDDRIELVDAVLDWRAGQHEGIGRAQRLHLPRRLDLPVLDALRLVEHDHVGMQDLVDVRRIAEHLLVVHDGEECGLAVGARRAGRGPNTERAGRSVKRAICSSHSAFSEAGHTTRTRSMPRGGPKARRLRSPEWSCRAPSRLRSKSPLAERQVKHAFALIGQQRIAQHVECCRAVLDLRKKGRTRLLARALAAQSVKPWCEVARHPDPVTNGSGRKMPS